MNVKPRRRWYQFSLWTVFVVVTLASLACGWVAYRQGQRPLLGGEVLKKAEGIDAMSFLAAELPGRRERYCLIPPLGRNPFASETLEKYGNVRLYATLTDLAAAINGTPDSVEVAAAIPRHFRPSLYPLRSLTRKEFTQLRALIDE